MRTFWNFCVAAALVLPLTTFGCSSAPQTEARGDATQEIVAAKVPASSDVTDSNDASDSTDAKDCPTGYVSNEGPFDAMCPVGNKVLPPGPPVVDDSCVCEGSSSCWFWWRYACQYEPNVVITSDDPRYVAWSKNPAASFGQLPYCLGNGIPENQTDRYSYYVSGCDSAKLAAQAPIDLKFKGQTGSMSFDVDPKGAYPTKDDALKACEAARVKATPPSDATALKACQYAYDQEFGNMNGDIQLQEFTAIATCCIKG
jgi:hypothetical protein